MWRASGDFGQCHLLSEFPMLQVMSSLPPSDSEKLPSMAPVLGFVKNSGKAQEGTV